ncbi:MAG: aldo/keto reductase [Candidatus Bathyarchaeia archaeon]
MKTVRLGKTGLKVSQVGMGGIPITRPPIDEAVKVIQHALDLGVNFIDTSPGYKDSEERIGKAIAGRRDQVILATKTGGDKATALKYLERSLKGLNTDYIDLWQFQNISNFENYEQVLRLGGGMEAAQEALQAGKIRHIGMSSHNVEVARKAITSGHFETIMFPFNFVENDAADKLVPLAKKHDVGFLAMKPFAGGQLKDTDLAIKYLLQFDNVVPTSGIEEVEEIEEIVDIVNGSWELTSQQQQEIEDIRGRLSTRFCRQCECCLPCPQGVFIPGVLYLRVLWGLWPPEWFLSWKYVKRSVESAKNCDQCGECEEKCPYHLPIREMIGENIKFYESMLKETE